MTDRPLVFSRHALNRMRRYGVSRERVTTLLTSPNATTPGLRGRYTAWKQTATGWLSVTYVDEPPQHVVVTATVWRRGPPNSEGAPE
jgi:Domain of unknown function (DUF4258)